MLLVHDERSRTQIQVSCAGTHHQTLYRRQTHRRIHTLTVQHCGTTATASDMSGYNLLFLRIYAQELTHTCTHVAVTCAVEAVAANRIFLVQLVRKSIHVCVVRHRLVERRIEHGYLRYTRQNLLDRINTLQVSRVMQRSQFYALDDHLLYFLSD